MVRCSVKICDFGLSRLKQAGNTVQSLANADFASQTLLLAPGRYQLSMRVLRGPDDGGDSGLAWSVTCQPVTKMLLTLPLSKAAGSPQMLAGPFTVPAGCRSQLLRLAGTAREYGSAEQVTLSDLQLVRLAP